AGLATPAFPTQAAVWGDFDNDGWLDLYVGNESRAGLDEEPGGDFPSQLFRNNGDGTFTDIGQRSGVTNDRYCKGVAAGDYDNDGDLDLYVSNRGPNRLYRNDGDMRFTEVTDALKVVEPQGQSFACWFFDYDNDGWLDLFVAAYESSNADVAADYIGIPNRGVKPCLYRNRGDGTFTNVAQQVGLDKSLLPMGANFGDIDNDGYLDIYLTTGRPDFATLTPNVMFQNVNGNRFQDVTFSAGLGHLQKGHGIAFADIDNDGDQDLYHQLGGFYPGDKFHNALFRNPLADESQDDSNQFVYLKLTGVECNRQAIGARIKVVAETESAAVRQFHRSVGAVSSFGGSPLRQEIGLGDCRRVVRIEILWPGTDQPQVIENVKSNCLLSVVQNKEPVVVELPVLRLGK
ncbi:MAG: CRTAC1 family protein, partial [Planctomycetota bacterium]